MLPSIGREQAFVSLVTDHLNRNNYELAYQRALHFRSFVSFLTGYPDSGMAPPGPPGAASGHWM